MSIQRINQYYAKIEDAKQFSGSKKETSIRRYFANLLSDYAEDKKLRLVDEVTLKNINKRPDGALVNRREAKFGYWEAKDLEDDLEKEIIKKINIGYPTFNLLIEDSKTAVLIQDKEREYCDMSNAKALHALITKFMSYESPEIVLFNAALAKFSQDVPEIVKILRKMLQNLISKEQTNSNNENTYNEQFVEKRQDFFEICKVSINQKIKYADIDEMIIQHILTEELFKTVFSDTQFHEENNISKALTAIEKTFFTTNLKRDITSRMGAYYEVIKTEASKLETHVEKQNFLKVLYEDFYKAYNPKGADTLGIVYTPLPVVRFMIKTTDYLIEKHFDKTLADKNVHILDPATGTGTFITDLLDYLPKQNLAYKYKNEIHANELAILPYYIAYLNIEYTFNEKMGVYDTFDNLCWVDTLDNIDALNYANKQVSLIGNATSENFHRIKAQNERKISVIIGNPPYNANQRNENDDNKNREYYSNPAKKEGGVDGRIKDTYVKQGTAQKTKQYDPYKRFFRWASDRMKNDGVIAFITNRAFIDSTQDDGFRKCVKEEFQEVHIVDLKGDIRSPNPTQGGNIFGIQLGVAICFLIKNETLDTHRIYYYNVGDSMSKEDKLQMLQDNALKQLPQEKINPDKNHNWINLSVSDFDRLLPLAESDNENELAEVLDNEEDETNDKKQIVIGKTKKLFDLATLGVSTNRDEWVFDFDKDNLIKKASFFVETYNDILSKCLKPDSEELLKAYEKAKVAGKKVKKPQLVDEPTIWDTSIKWSSSLKIRFMNGIFLKLENDKITTAQYRPFTKQFYYADKNLSDRLTRNHYAIFGENLDKENIVIALINHSQLRYFDVFCSKILPDAGFSGRATPTIPLYTYTESGERVDNLTDWGLAQFVGHYSDNKITKLAVFHYIYGVLHTPAYKEKYALDLKRAFPRIPFYLDFWKYANAGGKLMALHLDYGNGNSLDFSNIKDLENLKILNLPLESMLPKRKKTETDIFGNNESEQENVALLKKLQPEIYLRKTKTGTIEIDQLSSISGIPTIAWEYKLGNRSAIEWVLDQYKPYKSNDLSIQTSFNDYKFADFKEEVIKLLVQVIHVSVETTKIVKEL